MGIVLDIVPNHMAADDANRYWSDPQLRAALLRHRPGHRAAPALLRHLRPGGRAPGGPRGVRAHARAGARAGRARGSSTGCGSTIPTGWPTRPATSRACATRGVEPCGWRRSSSPASGCATGRSRERSATSSSTTPARCSSTRPGEPALTALWERVSGDRRSFERSPHEAKLEQVRDHVRARARAAGARAAGDGGCNASARAGARVAAGLPHLRRAGAAAGRRRRPPRDRRPGCRPSSPGCCCSTGARRARVRHPLSADDAGDHGQGRRGHRLLSLRRLLALNEVGGDPGRFGIGSTTSTRRTPSARGASRSTC